MSVLMVVALNAPAVARVGLQSVELCTLHSIDIVWLNASGEKVDIDVAECDCTFVDAIAPLDSSARGLDSAVGFAQPTLQDAVGIGTVYLARGPPTLS